MSWYGNIAEDAVIYFSYNTNGADGASITRSTNGTISVYKNDDVTQSTAGVAEDEDFDVTGVHNVKIDTSADAFYEVGKDYSVILSAATIDTKTVNAVIGQFSIENRFQEVDVVKWLGSAAQGASGRPQVDVELIEGADPTDTIRDAIVDDATRIDASALNTATVTTIPAILVDTGTTLDTAIAAILVDTNELQTDWVNGGRLDLLLDATLADTNELQTDWTNGGRLDLLIDAILADTAELQTDWVNGGRLDLLIDAIKVVTDATGSAQSEPTGVPAVDATPLVKIAWLFMSLRNKVTITATKKTFYDDGGAAEWEKDLADDGSEYSESEGNAI